MLLYEVFGSKYIYWFELLLLLGEKYFDFDWSFPSFFPSTIFTSFFFLCWIGQSGQQQLLSVVLISASTSILSSSSLSMTPAYLIYKKFIKNFNSVANDAPCIICTQTFSKSKYFSPKRSNNSNQKSKTKFRSLKLLTVGTSN